MWRYIHLGFGLVLVVYHSRIAYFHYGLIDTVWDASIDKWVSMTLIFMVMWTGFFKWPIYPWQEASEQEEARGKSRIGSGRMIVHIL